MSERGKVPSHTRPLFGKRVLVTRAKEQAGTLSTLLEAAGAEPVELPTIEFQPPDDVVALDNRLRNLSSYDWVIFTSANGVKAFLSRLNELGPDTGAMGSVKLCAIGPATAAELGRHKLKPDLVPKEFVGEAVAEGLKALGTTGKRMLLPKAQVAREVIAEELRREGAEVDEIAAYKTVPPRDIDQRVRRLADERIDVITLTSSSTARNLVTTIENHLDKAGARGFFDRAVIACIGPVTADTARDLGLRVDVVASEYTIPGLVDAIIAHCE